ncbi:MAG TPA: ribosomal protein S18-alanine N-acetyltransferase [Gemmatimonadaceae bacterium]|jgi:ribosomal-protein-alanine acetyltransferase
MSSDQRHATLRVQIRDATGLDVEGVAAIERSVFADPWSRRSFAELLASPHVIFLVACEPSGTPAGYAVILAAGQESELANLAVAREVQRGGIGRQLLAAGIRAAAAQGCRQMFLEVRASNAAAIALYESLGFRPVGRRPRYYVRPVEDAIIMRGELGAGRSSPVGGVPPSLTPLSDRVR